MKQLVEENRQMKQRVLELTEQSSGYLKRLDQQEEEIRRLESKSRAVTAARQIEGSMDSDKVKVKIDELVREIDRCINLLSR